MKPSPFLDGTMRRPFSRKSSLERGASVLFVASLAAGCNALSGATKFDLGQEETLPADAGEPQPLVDAGVQTVAPEDAGASEDSEPDASAPVAKRVFVTQRLLTGAVGGIESADQECRYAALTAGLRSTKWVAWMSNSSQNAIDRVRDAPYTLVDGTMVAPDKEQLRSGQLLSPINRMENGELAPTGPEEVRVWTGTRSDGMAASPDTCLDWTSSKLIDFGVLGFLVASDGQWTRAPGAVQSGGGWGCQTLGRLYCFEL